MAPSPHWSEKARRLHSGHESRAASKTTAMKWLLVAPSPLRSAKTRRLHLGRESLESAHFGRAGQAGRAVAFGVAPFPESRRIHLGRESRAVSTSVEKALKDFLKVAPSPCWSGKSRRLHLVLESLEIAKFGRAGHAIS